MGGGDEGHDPVRAGTAALPPTAVNDFIIPLQRRARLDIYLIRVEGFRWHDWNLGKIAKHGVSRQEAEYVVSYPARPYPRRGRGKGIWEVIGRGQGDRLVEVAYLLDPDGTIFVIHAMPLSTRRRRRRRG